MGKGHDVNPEASLQGHAIGRLFSSLQSLALLACLLAGAFIPGTLSFVVIAVAAAAVINPGASVALAVAAGLLKGSNANALSATVVLPVDMTIVAAALLGLNALAMILDRRCHICMNRWTWLLVLSGVVVAVSSATSVTTPPDVLFSAGWRYVVITVPMALLTGVLCSDRKIFQDAVWTIAGIAFVWVGAALRTMLTSLDAVASVGSVDYIASATWASLAVLSILVPALAGRNRANWFTFIPAVPASAVLVGAPSRGILAATAGVAGWLALRGTRSLRAAVYRMLLLGLVLGVLLSTYTFLARTRAGMSVGRLLVWSPDSGSIGVRMSLWHTAWGEFADSPVFGSGIGATEAKLGIGSYPHGLPQQALAELGLVGSAVFFPLWIMGLAAGIRLCSRAMRSTLAVQPAEYAVLSAWTIVLALDCLVSSSIADARTFLLSLAAVAAAAHIRPDQAGPVENGAAADAETERSRS